MKFKLLEGKHQDKQGEKGAIRKFVKGDIIETEQDLAKIFNSPGGGNKFERLPDDKAPAETEDAEDDESGGGSDSPTRKSGW